MEIITKVIADYTVFAIYGENETANGEVSVRVVDFANECIYNALISKDHINDSIISEEVFDESCRLCGFILPNGTKVSIDYNDFNMPTKIKTSIGNNKDIEYYPSGCVKSIVSYFEPTGIVFWKHIFKDKEAPLEEEYEAAAKKVTPDSLIKKMLEDERLSNLFQASLISSDNDIETLNDRYQTAIDIKETAEEAREIFSKENDWEWLHKTEEFITSMEACILILKKDMKEMEE